jgi:hypothetical protein
MRDRDLYAQILGIKPPWKVVDVELDIKESHVTVRGSGGGTGNGSDHSAQPFGGTSGHSTA